MILFSQMEWEEGSQALHKSSVGRSVSPSQSKRGKRERVISRLNNSITEPA